MSIEKDSPHLAGALRRALDPGAPQRLCSVWNYAVDHDALIEPDFVRPPTEIRFNPRPARITLILLHEGRILDETAIAASMLACVRSPDAAELRALFTKAGDIAATAVLPPERLLAEHRENVTALAIASALWLDRARHLHRSPRAAEEDFRSDFLTQTQLYLETARSSSEQIHALLAAWRSRFDDREFLRSKLR